MRFNFYCFTVPPLYAYNTSIWISKTSVYILKPCRDTSQSFEESLRRGKLVKNLEVFLMNEWMNEWMYFCWIRLSYDVISISRFSSISINSSHHDSASFRNCGLNPENLQNLSTFLECGKLSSLIIFYCISTAFGHWTRTEYSIK